MTNDQLIRAIAAGKRDVLSALYLRERDRCVKYLLKRIIPAAHPNREELALDLFKDALIALVENVEQGRLTKFTAEPATYLNTITRNKFLNEQKRKREITGLSGEIPFLALEPLDLEERQLIQSEVRRELNRLGEKCRRLLTYFYFLEFSYEDIVQRIGYGSIDSAKTAKAKCLKRLRKAYANSSRQTPKSN